MPESQILPLDDTTNVELTAEEFNNIIKEFNLYVKNNPDLAKEVVYSHLKELFVPYII